MFYLNNNIRFTIYPKVDLSFFLKLRVAMAEVPPLPVKRFSPKLYLYLQRTLSFFIGG
tara:strand:+ start:433 stop:606 length:174 start_codon:yes stop_codon:yes gene_type:complete